MKNKIDLFLILKSGSTFIFLMMFCVCMAGCWNKELTIEELKENSGIMLSAGESNYGLVDSSSDYWSGRDYEIYYDGRIHVECDYHLSGSVVDYEATLSDEDYEILVNILRKYFVRGRCDKKVDACDGSSWFFTYYDIDGEELHEFHGYICGIEKLEKIQDILESYIPEYEIPPLYPEDIDEN